MATVTTHDLIQCSRVFPTLPSVNPLGLSIYNGLLVKFDNNNARSYRVRQNVQARFKHPTQYLSSEDEHPGDHFGYSITSMMMNGVEMLSAPANYIWDSLNVEFTSYPYY